MDNDSPESDAVSLSASGLLKLSSNTTLNRHTLKIGEQVTGSGFHYSISTGNLKLGGGNNVNQDADILLYKGGIDIEAASANDSSIHLSAEDSRIDLRRSSNKINKIALDGNAGNISLRSPSDGAATFYFEALNGNLKIGGGSPTHAANGDILLYRSGVDIKTASASEASIHLDGDAGDMVLQNGDFAEEFDTDDCIGLEPGVVLTLKEVDYQDSIAISDTAYDRKVVGVYSGAGSYKPGLILESLLEEEEEFL